MKRILRLTLILLTLVLIGACGKSDRPEVYPNVYNGDLEPKGSQQIEIKKPQLQDFTKKEINYLDISKPGGVTQPVLQPEKPPTKGQDVDLFNLLHEVQAPMGCTTGVDC